VDEGGVALAAIQGLNQKLEEKDAKIQQLQQSVDELKKMVQSLADKK
jgi:phage shock protein A